MKTAQTSNVSQTSDQNSVTFEQFCKQYDGRLSSLGLSVEKKTRNYYSSDDAKQEIVCALFERTLSEGFDAEQATCSYFWKLASWVASNLVEKSFAERRGVASKVSLEYTPGGEGEATTIETSEGAYASLTIFADRYGSTQARLDAREAIRRALQEAPADIRPTIGLLLDPPAAFVEASRDKSLESYQTSRGFETCLKDEIYTELGCSWRTFAKARTYLENLLDG